MILECTCSQPGVLLDSPLPQLGILSRSLETLTCSQLEISRIFSFPNAWNSSVFVRILFPVHIFKDIPFYRPEFLKHGKSTPAKQRKVSAISNGFFLGPEIINYKELQEIYDHFC
jgi:hypothetical protein